jgi:competence protein ComEC
MITNSKLFLFSCVSLVVGIVAASFLPIATVALGIIWFVVLLVSLVGVIIWWHKLPIRTGLLIILFFCLAIWRYGLTIPQDLPNKIWYYNGQVEQFTGKVVLQPKVNGARTQLVVKVRSLQTEQSDEQLLISGRVLLFADTYPQYEFGDELAIKCKLQAPQPLDSFDYDRYLARSQIYSICFYPQISLLAKHPNFFTYLYRVKQKLTAIINRGLTEPAAGLAIATLLGDNNMPDSLQTMFSRTGLSHVVAISGMNISILSMLLLSLLLLVGVHRRQIIYYTTGILAIYILLIGAQASAMRAGILGFLALLAMHVGRLKHATNALAAAAAIMLLINPRALRDDVGFQLSFLAVLGIIWFYPWLKQLIADRVKKKWQPQSRVGKAGLDIFLITITAQIFTLPVIAWNFKTISIIAPVANILVIWLLPLLLISLIAAIGLSLIIPVVTIWWFAPSLVMLKYMIAVATMLSGVPGAAWVW